MLAVCAIMHVGRAKFYCIRTGYRYDRYPYRLLQGLQGYITQMVVVREPYSVCDKMLRYGYIDLLCIICGTVLYCIIHA